MVAPSRADEVVTPAYDALTVGARRDAQARSPWTFLHALPAETRPGRVTAVDLDRCADAVARLERAAFDRVAAPFVAVYRLQEDDHVQTGLIADLDVGALGDVVRGHEETRRDREDDLVRYLRRVGVQSSPVCLAAPDDDRLAAALAAATTGTPTVTVSGPDLLQHLWVVTDGNVVAALLDATAGVGDAVITDGHHRAAACLRHARSAAPRATAAGRLLVAIFAASDLRVSAFHRVVGPPLPVPPAGLPEALRARGLVVHRAHATGGAAPGVAVMTAGGGSWEVALPASDAAATDVQRLQSAILAPVLGVVDPRADGRLSYVPASLPGRALADAVGRDGVGFATVAPGVADLLEAARTGRSLPPKSTYVHPKARSGLLLVPRRA